MPHTFWGYPISGRSITIGRLLFEHGEEPPTDRPVLLRRVARTAIHRGRFEQFFEVAYRVEEWSPATFREFMPELPPSSVGRDRLKAVLDGARDARSVVGAALRGFAGSPPVAGLGAGLHSVLAAPRIDGTTALEAARALSILRPPWEHSGIPRRGRRLWAGDTVRFPSYMPYSILVDKVSGQGSYGSHPLGFDRSSVLSSPTVAPVIESLLLGADDPVIRPAAEIEALAMRPLAAETAGPASSVLLMSHAVEPAQGGGAGLERAIDDAVESVAESHRTLLETAGSRDTSLVDLVRTAPRTRDAVARTALSIARTEFATDLTTAHIRQVAKEFADSVAAATSHASGADLRGYRVGADLVASAREIRRLELVDALLAAHPGSTLHEIWTQVSARGTWSSLADLERWIERRIAEGRYFQIDGRFRKS